MKITISDICKKAGYTNTTKKPAFKTDSKFYLATEYQFLNLKVIVLSLCAVHSSISVSHNSSDHSSKKVSASIIF